MLLKVIRKRETVSTLWLQSATWMKNIKISYLVSFMYISVVSNKEIQDASKMSINSLHILLHWFIK